MESPKKKRRNKKGILSLLYDRVTRWSSQTMETKEATSNRRSGMNPTSRRGQRKPKNGKRKENRVEGCWKWRPTWRPTWRQWTPCTQWRQWSPKWVAFTLVVVWLHVITLGVVVDGEKGLLTRFLWSFLFLVGPLLYFIQNRTWRKTCAALLYFQLGTCIMSSSNSIAWYRNPINLRPLPDLGHDTFPEWKKITLPWMGTLEAAIVPDAVMGFLSIVTVVFALRHHAGWKIIQRFFLIYGSLCMMRAVTVISTSLPDSAEKCRMLSMSGNLPNGAHGWEAMTLPAVVARSIRLLIPSGQGELTCGDMVFSGHSMLMVLCAMTWHTYYKNVPGSVNYIKVTIWAITIFGLLAIVMVRMHYTLDVLLAFYMAITIFSSYHKIANDVQIGHRFSSLWIIDDLIIYPMVEWFERDDSPPTST